MHLSVHTTCDFYDYLLFGHTHCLPQAIEVAILLFQMKCGGLYLIFFLHIILNILFSILRPQFSVRTYFFLNTFFSATIKHILSQQEKKCLVDTLIIFPSFCPFFILYFLPSPPLILLSIIISFLSSKITSCTGFPHSSPEATIVREIVFIFFHLKNLDFSAFIKTYFL